MTKPKKPIELNFEDLAGGGAAATGPEVIKPGEAPAAEAETGGDLVSQIEGFFDRANSLVTNVKELINMWKGFNPGPGLGPGQGTGPQPYTQQPTLMQQLHRLLNVIYSAYGDITVAQALEALMQQYGNTKLSAVLKVLEKLQ